MCACLRIGALQLVFGYYNFLRLKRSKRLCLESIQRENCLLVEKLSPSECTYGALQNGDVPLLAPAVLDSSREVLFSLPFSSQNVQFLCSGVRVVEQYVHDFLLFLLSQHLQFFHEPIS